MERDLDWYTLMEVYRALDKSKDILSEIKSEAQKAIGASEFIADASVDALSKGLDLAKITVNKLVETRATRG